LAVKYIIFVIDTATNSGNPGEMKAIDAFNDELQANAHWVFAAGISAPSKAKLFDYTGENQLTRDVSLFKDDHFYSGFWVIEAESAAVAEELAAKGSHACNRRVELRPFL
jgi:hypothetical protein